MGHQDPTHLIRRARTLSRQTSASLAARPTANSLPLVRLRMRLHAALDNRASALLPTHASSPTLQDSELLENAAEIAELAEIDAEVAALTEGRRADSCRLAELLAGRTSARRWRPQTPEEDERETREFFGFLPGDKIT